MRKTGVLFVCLFPFVFCQAPAGTLAAEAAAPAAPVVEPHEAAAGYLVVSDPEAPVLVGPSTDYAVLQKVREGDILLLKGKQGNWYYVQTTANGHGWIYGDALAAYDYPEYLLQYRPPDDWVPPSPNWVPPPGWAPPPGWVKRSAGWQPPPRWRPKWWPLWYQPVARTPLAPRRPVPAVKKPPYRVPPPFRPIPPARPPRRR